MSPVDWSGCPLVEVVPGKVSGAPLLGNTRLPVTAITGNYDALRDEGLSADSAISETLDCYPEVGIDIIKAILSYRDEPQPSPTVAQRAELDRRHASPDQDRRDEILHSFARFVQQDEDTHVGVYARMLDEEIIDRTQCLDLDGEFPAGARIVSEEVNLFCVSEGYRGL